MRVKVTIPAYDVDKLRAKILETAESVEKDGQGANEWEAVSIVVRISTCLC